MDITKYIIELHSNHSDGFTNAEAEEIIGDDYDAIIEILESANVVIKDDKYLFTDVVNDIVNYP